MFPRVAPVVFARAFALCVLAGAPLFRTHAHVDAFVPVDGVAALVSMYRMGEFTRLSDGAARALTILYAPARLVRAVLPGTTGDLFVDVSARAMRKAAQMHEAAGNSQTIDLSFGCALATVGAVKQLVLGDIGPFGLLAAIVVVYSTVMAEAGGCVWETAHVVGTSVFVASGLLSSRVVNKTPARERVKSD
ncbi:unnamed product [Ostreococcus tauri]|uniref:Unnamed product n=1 Tax=Ostreococcus tauri TaxID=70448 RepID=A0A090M0Q7_OSTTA|nr:unnamed product [Ostreococcus tauri]CEF97766.1 unnamed product [Ostreococcus tauri]|eukprot:XP_003079057.2 unnamed product [Ostreococcus tauri]